MLTLLCLFLYIPGMASIPPIDRDEARYAQATKQMLETENYVDIRFQDTPRHKKPAGIYWLQAASVSLFSDAKSASIWPYRIPSLLSAWFTVLVTYFIGFKFFSNEKKAFYGAAFLASSLLLTVEAHMAKTDATMLLFVVIAQGALGLLYSKFHLSDKEAKLLPIIFWTALGLGIMIKGPVLPTICIMTIATLCYADKNWQWLKKLNPKIGIPITLLICLPWLIAIQKISGGGFLQESIGKDFLPKLFSGQESHGAPPGYYALVMIITLWPTSFFAWKGLHSGIKNRATPAVRFLLAWIIPSWILFEIIPTKLPHYVLPLYPAICLLIAYALFKEKANSTEAHIMEGGFARITNFIRKCYICKSLPYIWRGFYVLITIAFACLFITAPIILKTSNNAALGGFIPATAYITFACIMICFHCYNVHKHHSEKELTNIIKQAIIVLFIVFAFVLPKLDHIWVSKQVHTAIRANTKYNDYKIIAAGFHEPSLVFYMGTKTALTTGKTAANQLMRTPNSIAIIEASEDKSFRNAFSKRNPPIEIIATIRGNNYSKGKEITLNIYKIRNNSYLNRRQQLKAPF